MPQWASRATQLPEYGIDCTPNTTATVTDSNDSSRLYHAPSPPLASFESQCGATQCDDPTDPSQTYMRRSVKGTFPSRAGSLRESQSLRNHYNKPISMDSCLRAT
eukprot:590254-Rhodomonas_salina.1